MEKECGSNVESETKISVIPLRKGFFENVLSSIRMDWFDYGFAKKAAFLLSGWESGGLL